MDVREEERVRAAWRRSVSLGLVDQLWPADVPRDLELARLVSVALLSGKPRVSRGGNPAVVLETTVAARAELEAKVGVLAARLRDTWQDLMRGVDVHGLRKTHRTWARARGVLGEAIDAHLGHAGHEDAATSAALRAAAGSRIGRKHYLDIASKVFDPGTSARAVREVLDQALAEIAREGTSMLLPTSEGQAGEKPPTAAILRA